jgi:hypothetical protein
MVSGGLSFTDFGKKEVIGGYALEFYQRVGRHYGMPGFGNDVAWYHEPHVAEAILREMLREAGVAVFEKHRLREKDGVTKSGAEVRAIRLENGATFAAKIFVDSSYEGDLMAQAGISYTYGREGSAQYSEWRACAIVLRCTNFWWMFPREMPLASCCLRFRRAACLPRGRRTKQCRPTTIGCASPMFRQIAWRFRGPTGTIRVAMRSSPA